MKVAEAVPHMTKACFAAKEDDVFQRVTTFEQQVLADAADPDSLKYEDDQALDILQAVLDVALEDQRVSDDELRLIQRLRQKLGVHEKSKRILLARLGHFPQAGNEPHTPAEVRNALTELQRHGVLFYCNRLDHGTYVIHEEIVPGVKKALGIELNEAAWALLLNNLSNDHLATILAAANLPRSGTKEERANRMMACGVRPSARLDAFSNGDLCGVCQSPAQRSAAPKGRCCQTPTPNGDLGRSICDRP